MSETEAVDMNEQMAENIDAILEGVESGIAEVEGEVSALEQARAEYRAMLDEPGLEQREVQIEVMEKFTEAQLAERGQDLAAVLMDLAREEEEFASQRDAHKIRKKEFEEMRDTLRDEIENGQGLVKVNAIETFVPKARKAITRTLEGTIVKERTLSEDEMADRAQGSLLPMSEAEVTENAKAFLGDDQEESNEEQLEAARANIRNGKAKVPAV